MQFPSWSHTNIAVKELLPIVLAVQLWGPIMANSRMLFMCDNMSIVAVINSRTSKDRSIMDLLRKLAIATMSHNIHFAAKHIPVNSTQPQMHCLGFRTELRDKWPHGSARQPTTSFQRCCPGEGRGAIHTGFTCPKLTHSLRQICHASPRLCRVSGNAEHLVSCPCFTHLYFHSTPP